MPVQSQDFPQLDSVEKIEQGFESHGYICSRKIATAVFLAFQLRKPVLVEGPPGVGKTELAKTTAMTELRDITAFRNFSLTCPKRWILGRADDVISSAGYRIGPGEIEDCLMQHPAVLQAAAVGVPNPEGLLGDIVKAYIVLADGFSASDQIEQEIQQTVRQRLAAYEYPRAIEFIDALPMTTTGKVRRIELRQRNLG